MTGEALLEVSAQGPEEVPFEKTAVREFAAPLRLAGTYVVHALLDGVGLSGAPLCHALPENPAPIRLTFTILQNDQVVLLSIAACTSWRIACFLPAQSPVRG